MHNMSVRKELEDQMNGQQKGFPLKLVKSKLGYICNFVK